VRLWRISQFPGLTGIGGTLVDGRWHSKPAYVVYAAEHPALAMVEVLATMRVTLTALPLNLRLFAIDVKKGAKISPALDLPNGWQANQPTTQALGNAWLAARQGLLLKIPSAILPEASNVLINPLHRQAATHLTETDNGPFWVDPRFIR
jgi:RES domain-containing protein